MKLTQMTVLFSGRLFAEQVLKSLCLGFLVYLLLSVINYTVCLWKSLCNYTDLILVLALVFGI